MSTETETEEYFIIGHILDDTAPCLRQVIYNDNYKPTWLWYDYSFLKNKLQSSQVYHIICKRKGKETILIGFSRSCTKHEYEREVGFHSVSFHYEYDGMVILDNIFESEEASATVSGYNYGCAGDTLVFPLRKFTDIKCYCGPEEISFDEYFKTTIKYVIRYPEEDLPCYDSEE